MATGRNDSPIPANSPDDPTAQQFRSPMHGAQISHGWAGVRMRASDWIQGVERDRTFVREVFVAPETLGSGSAWDVAFTHDPEQRFIHLASGSNKIVHVLDRESVEVLTTLGDGGRQPGQFYGVHSIAVDSQGNVYTTETYEGKRVQKFVFQGLGTVAGEQGPPWPGGGT